MHSKYAVVCPFTPLPLLCPLAGCCLRAAALVRRPLGRPRLESQGAWRREDLDHPGMVGPGLEAQQWAWPLHSPWGVGAGSSTGRLNRAWVDWSGLGGAAWVQPDPSRPDFSPPVGQPLTWGLGLCHPTPDASFCILSVGEKRLRASFIEPWP